MFHLVSPQQEFVPERQEQVLVPMANVIAFQEGVQGKQWTAGVFLANQSSVFTFVAKCISLRPMFKGKCCVKLSTVGSAYKTLHYYTDSDIMWSRTLGITNLIWLQNMTI